MYITYIYTCMCVCVCLMKFAVQTHKEWGKQHSISDNTQHQHRTLFIHVLLFEMGIHAFRVSGNI